MAYRSILTSILKRLDAAIATAQVSSERVDEWNQPGAKWTKSIDVVKTVLE